MGKEVTQFKKGQSGNKAGRPPGIKNKLNFNVDQICSDLKCNPFVILAKIANDELELTPEQRKFFSVRLRMEAAAELAQYLAPKLKSVEHKGDLQNPVNMILNLG